jgi:GNAT superfamily N-acetyltransferase
MAHAHGVRYRRAMRVAPLLHSQLPFAEVVLEAACAFDRADRVAHEKLFGRGPLSAPKPGAPAPELASPSTFGVWNDAHELVGVAAACGRWLRVLAVHPSARGRGAGSALLAACEQAGARRTLDQPGNYLAPGIDVRNTETIAWLERRGWKRDGEPRTNVLIQVRDNPRVTAERARDLAAAAAAKGYEVRRARPDEHALLDAVAAEFGGAWPFELDHALTYERMLEYTGVRRPSHEHAPIDQAYVDSMRLRPDEEAALRRLHGDRAEQEIESTRRELARATPGVHVAVKDGQYCAFAAHDGNNMGLGWFGPTGTWPTHRGQGLGEALLVACLVDVAAEHERCEVAWIGPRAFYEKVAGIALDRHFVVLTKAD